MPRRPKALRILLAGVPSLSADALGLFRIAWGLGLVWALVSFAPDSAPEQTTRDYPWWGSWGFLDSLAGNTSAVAAIRTVTMIALALFVIGLFSRLAYAVAAAGFTLYLLTIAEWSAAGHDWMPLSVVVPLLVFVRWGDGFSLDETIRRLRGRGSPARPAGQGYGMALWLPGLCLGLAWLSAAHAKFSAYGSFEWATSGAVQYHWVTDNPGAPSDLGLALVSHKPVAVFLSFMGMALEALFITHIAFRRPLLRALYIVPALSLLLGFWMFQGVFWTPWWVLVLVLLPWQPIYDALARALPTGVAVVDSGRERCVARARVLHGLDWLNRVGFVEAADADALRLHAPALAEVPLDEGIAAVDPETGATYRGRAAWRRLARSVPLLWPAGLTFAAPAALRLGEPLAARRAPPPTWAGAPGPVRAVPKVALALTVLAIAFQLVATTEAKEQAPFFSDFPMYSTTYISRAAFDAQLARSFDDYELREERPEGTRDVTERLGEDGADTLIGATDAAYNDRTDLTGSPTPLREELRGELEQLRAGYRDSYGEELGPVDVVSISRPFLWDRGEFAKEPERLLVATVGTDDVVLHVPPDGEKPQRAQR